MIKKNQLPGILLIGASGAIILLSAFLLLTDLYTPLELYALSDYQPSFYIYSFPLICGLSIISVSVGLLFSEKLLRRILYFILIIALNLLFFYLIDILNKNGDYLWGYPSLLTVLGGIFLLLIGLLVTLSDFSHSVSIPQGEA